MYEAVLTILDIEADSGLRVLGVNILGKFLSNKDNNIRYVALNTLVKVVAVEPNAVQRHRNTILDCLRDPDISIRRRALDLSFTLINESNIRVLVRELLAFLEVANNEFKPTLTSEICIAADRFAPTKRWHIDTVLRVLKLAGNHVREQILSSFIRLIATSPEHQTYCVQKLYASLKADITQEGLTLAAAWVIGEYGRNLLQDGQYEEEELVVKVNDKDVVDLLSTILDSSYATQTVSEYIINALMKLTSRLSDQSQIDRIRRILQKHTSALDVEIQQRSVEYTNMFGYNEVRQQVLEAMPPPQIRDESRVFGEKVESAKKPAAGRRGKKIGQEEALLDLMGGDEPVTSPASNGGTSNADLLSSILGGGDFSGAGSGTSSPAPQAANSNVASILDLFNTPSNSTPVNVPASMTPSFTGGASNSAALLDVFGSSPAPVVTSPPPQAITPSSQPAALPVYNKNNLNITIQLQRTPDGTTNVLVRFKNDSLSESLSGVNLQAAVRKSQTLRLQPISSSDITPQGESRMAMKVGGAKVVCFLFIFVN